MTWLLVLAPLGAQADLLLCALVAVLCCGVLSASPIVVRQHMHLWLLAAVARAPLMLQPLLLLCHPARRVYLRCRWAARGGPTLGARPRGLHHVCCNCAPLPRTRARLPGPNPVWHPPRLASCLLWALSAYRDGGLAALHIAMFGLQFWSVNSRAADWLAGSPVLLSYPAGLWLLVAIFILQVGRLRCGSGAAAGRSARHSAPRRRLACCRRMRFRGLPPAEFRVAAFVRYLRLVVTLLSPC